MAGNVGEREILKITDWTSVASVFFRPVTRIEKNEKDRLDKMKISNHKRKFEIDDHDFDLIEI